MSKSSIQALLSREAFLTGIHGIDQAEIARLWLSPRPDRAVISTTPWAVDKQGYGTAIGGSCISQCIVPVSRRPGCRSFPLWQYTACTASFVPFRMLRGTVRDVPMSASAAAFPQAACILRLQARLECAVPRWLASQREK